MMEETKQTGQFQLKHTLSFSSLNGRKVVLKQGTILDGVYEEEPDTILIHDKVYGKILVRKQHINRKNNY